MNEILNELTVLRENGKRTIIELLAIRDMVNNLISMANMNEDILNLVEPSFEENTVYDSYCFAFSDLLRQMLLTNEQLQDVIQDVEASAIYTYLLDGQDYDEALNSLKSVVNPYCDDDPEVLYVTEEFGDPGTMVQDYLGYYDDEYTSEELDQYYDFYAMDPWDDVYYLTDHEMAQLNIALQENGGHIFPLEDV